MSAAAPQSPVPPTSSPVAVNARLEAPLSRWLWLVKWLLLIPHIVILYFLWIAFLVVTVVAFFAILFTARYPESLFRFNLGVLRWSWRVAYYGYSALGTDLYPPFSLGPEPDYPATLDIAYPAALSRGLVLVKWWLLAIPHYLILVFLVGGTWLGGWRIWSAWPWVLIVGPGGLLGIIVFFAAVALLFTARYPGGIFDLALGFDRWLFRVLAYATLMTDVYPPFRLDQGGSEPAGTPEPARATAGPADATPAVPTPPAPEPAATASVPAAPAAATPSAISPTPSGVPSRSGSAGAVVALVLGLLAFMAASALAGLGGAALWVNGKRDADGFLTTSQRQLVSVTPAITVENVDLEPDEGTGPWVAPDDFGNIRIQATSVGETPIFIGIAPQASVDVWLRGVAHDQVRGLTDDAVVYRPQVGPADVAPPTDEDFWVAQASGTGTQTITWPLQSGDWAFVLARADGAPGVRADVTAGVSIPSLAGLAWGLLLGGLLALVVAVVLIVLGAAGIGRGMSGGAGPPRTAPMGVPPGPGDG